MAEDCLYSGHEGEFAGLEILLREIRDQLYGKTDSELSGAATAEEYPGNICGPWREDWPGAIVIPVQDDHACVCVCVL